MNTGLSCLSFFEKRGWTEGRESVVRIRGRFLDAASGACRVAWTEHRFDADQLWLRRNETRPARLPATATTTIRMP